MKENVNVGESQQAGQVSDPASRAQLTGPIAALSADQKADSITLKWGTLKSWDIHSDGGMALLRRYHEIGCSMSAMAQKDTPEQKEIICQLIDSCAGEIYLDWNDEFVSKEKAKEYVRGYRS